MLTQIPAGFDTGTGWGVPDGVKLFNELTGFDYAWICIQEKQRTKNEP